VLLRQDDASRRQGAARRTERRPGEGHGRGHRDPEEAGRRDRGPADIPSVVDQDPKKNILLWSVCSGGDEAKGKDADCSIVFKYGMKRDFNKWLASLGPAAPVKTLTELRQWNLTHTKAGALKYGQSNLDISDEMDVQADKARYEADRAKDIALSA